MRREMREEYKTNAQMERNAGANLSGDTTLLEGGPNDLGFDEGCGLVVM
jgi:hypothetical protein